MAEVVLSNLFKRLGANQILNGLSLDIKDGEFVTLLGPSGCGKTTLLRMIAGLESIDKGELMIGGRRCNDIPAQNRNLAMVFQSYALFPHMTVAENIRFGLKINKASAETIKTKLVWAIHLFRLTGLEDRLPREISGGQRQRVALARALVLDPDVLLLDEPLSNLDTALRDQAMEELKRIHNQVGKTIIYVTHNQAEAMTMSQRIAVLNGGKCEQYDTPRTVYDAPRTTFAASFIGSPVMNFIDGTVAIRGVEDGVDTDLGFIRIDNEWRTKVEALAGKSVRVGLRPQNIAFADHQESKRYSDTTIRVEVDLVETLGDRNLVVCRGKNNILLRFLVNRDISLSPGDAVDVYLDGRRILLFDPETGVNVLTS